MSKSVKVNKSTKKATIDPEIIKNNEHNENKEKHKEHKTSHKLLANLETVPVTNQLVINNLHSPYIDTTLVCPVMLFPNQMDNKMYLHIKDNLSSRLVGRCYKNYGYIVKIYKIDEISDGIIEPEDPTCSTKFVVKFSCRLCIPIKNKEIILKIDRMNKAFVGGINGPLQAVITPDKINPNKFYLDNNRNIRIRGTSDILLPDMYIRVLVLSSTFSDYEKTILVIGFLQDIATEEEYQKYMKKDTE